MNTFNDENEIEKMCVDSQVHMQSIENDHFYYKNRCAVQLKVSLFIIVIPALFQFCFLFLFFCMFFPHIVFLLVFLCSFMFCFCCLCMWCSFCWMLFHFCHSCLFLDHFFFIFLPIRFLLFFDESSFVAHITLRIIFFPNQISKNLIYFIFVCNFILQISNRTKYNVKKYHLNIYDINMNKLWSMRYGCVFCNIDDFFCFHIWWSNGILYFLFNVHIFSFRIIYREFLSLFSLLILQNIGFRHLFILFAVNVNFFKDLFYVAKYKANWKMFSL